MAFIVVVVGALQLSAGELIGLVEAELVGDSPVSLLLLLSVAADGSPERNMWINNWVTKPLTVLTIQFHFLESIDVVVNELVLLKVWLLRRIDVVLHVVVNFLDLVYVDTVVVDHP